MGFLVSRRSASDKKIEYIYHSIKLLIMYLKIVAEIHFYRVEI